ncbi:patatin-like phospholipase family protein [Pseudonocardia sp. CA-107938]|uniref:patatin-like phospholipase family protein n=1 Tax=Pseudonocardia sp. CA-107938 TaxID=3240021 RepID=UPI003D8ED2F5
MTTAGLPFVQGDRDVLQVLVARREAGSAPGARTDAHRVALVIGGGGMRGSYAAGMLRALQEQGLTRAFDEVYGSSSGALLAAAFVTGGAAGAAESYAEDMTTREFIDMRRLGSRRPVLALNYLLDDIMGDRRPLDWDALGTTPAALHLVATDTADLTAHTLTGMTGRADWRQALAASATIPLLAGPPAEFGGRRWVDGSVAEPLATARAIRGGATHVLVMLCRGAADRGPEPGPRMPLWARGLDRVAAGLGTLSQGSRRYGAELRLVTEPEHPLRGTARLAAIAPESSSGVGSLTVERELVAAAVEIGAGSALRAVQAAERDQRAA